MRYYLSTRINDFQQNFDQKSEQIMAFMTERKGGEFSSHDQWGKREVPTSFTYVDDDSNRFYNQSTRTACTSSYFGKQFGGVPRFGYYACPRDPPQRCRCMRTDN